MKKSIFSFLRMYTALFLVCWCQTSARAEPDQQKSQTQNKLRIRSSGQFIAEAQDPFLIGDGSDSIDVSLDTIQNGGAFISVINASLRTQRIMRIRTTDFHMRDLMGNEMPNTVLV